MKQYFYQEGEYIIKIVDIVKFNDYHAFVFDEIPPKLYEKHGDLLIGYDNSKTIIDCLYYERPSGRFYAFAGREFDLPLRDGGSIHCYGQYWDGKSSDCAKVLGIDICPLTASTKEELSKCYVFCSYYADRDKLNKMIEEFQNENPDYKVWEYREYEKYLKSK